MGRTMQKNIFGHMRTLTAQISRISAQSDQDLHCPLTESLDTTECMNREQRPGWYCAHVQDFTRVRRRFSSWCGPYIFWSRPQWLSWMRRPTGDQQVAGSTPAEVGNILSWRLIMKYFLRSFSPFRWLKKGSCQFLAKECAQYWSTA